jgi:hypothetical protein
MKCKIDGCEIELVTVDLCRKHVDLYTRHDCTPQDRSQFIKDYNNGFRVIEVWAKRGSECLSCGSSLDEMPDVKNEH